MISPSDLESQIALLTFSLKMRRLSGREKAVYFNRLVRAKPRKGLEARVEDLITELRQW